MAACLILRAMQLVRNELPPWNLADVVESTGSSPVSGAKMGHVSLSTMLVEL